MVGDCWDLRRACGVYHDGLCRRDVCRANCPDFRPDVYSPEALADAFRAIGCRAAHFVHAHPLARETWYRMAVRWGAYCPCGFLGVECQNCPERNELHDLPCNAGRVWSSLKSLLGSDRARDLLNDVWAERWGEAHQ